MSEDTTNILIYGDSNTWGFTAKSFMRLPHSHRWTTILQKLLGEGYHIIAEGLNGRTTVYNDLSLFEDGEYNMDGRTQLPAILHSHKPLDVIIIALGANDLKAKYNTTAADVALGVKTLVRDVQKMSNIGRHKTQGHRVLNRIPPKIIVMGLPTIHNISPFSEMYSLPLDVTAKAVAANGFLQRICEEIGVQYVSIEDIGISELDGLHFEVEHQAPLANILHTALTTVARESR